MVTVVSTTVIIARQHVEVFHIVIVMDLHVYESLVIVISTIVITARPDVEVLHGVVVMDLHVYESPWLLLSHLLSLLLDQTTEAA